MAKKFRLITIKRNHKVETVQKDGSVKEQMVQKNFYARVNNEIVPDHRMLEYNKVYVPKWDW